MVNKSMDVPTFSTLIPERKSTSAFQRLGRFVTSLAPWQYHSKSIERYASTREAVFSKLKKITQKSFCAENR